MKLLNCIAPFLFTAAAVAQSPGTFQLIARYHGIGGQLATLVGPGPKPGSERLYASYYYGEKSLDVLSIDPESGSTEIFHSPVPTELGAWGITVGPKGNVFLGTLPDGHLLKLDSRQHTFIDLGRPSSTEQYIWAVAFGSDSRLYGATYPGCKLVRYDPETGRLEDLGRMDPTEQYARSIAASSDGFIYVGIGSVKANIAAYNIRTGEHREILPLDAQISGFPKIIRGRDGTIYAAVGTRQFRLSKWTATELDSQNGISPAPANTLSDGRILSLVDSNGILKLTVTDPATHKQTEHAIDYQGHELSLFRIGFGPDGGLYGSSVLPANLVRIDLAGKSVEEIGNVGKGEVYSFLSYGKSLLMGAYSGLSTLMSFEPGVPFHPAAGSGNPLLIPLKSGNESWRPMAMIDSLDGTVYVGTVAAYGRLESPLIEWKPQAASVELIDGIASDQSIVSLATSHGLILCGTSVTGGGGSRPTQRDAKLVIWNPTTHQKEFDLTPVPGAPSITDLVSAPNGLIYGIAGTTLFEFNPTTREITKKQAMPFAKVIYNGASVDEAGRIWGLAEDGIFMIDTKTFRIEIVARPSTKITGGYASRNGKLYFISGSAVYCYTI